MTKDFELVERHLKTLKPDQKVGTRAKLIAHFAMKWNDEARATSAVNRAVEAGVLHVGKGGALKYSGNDAGIYADVRAGLTKWQPDRGWRVADQPIDCHSRKGSRGAGDWLYPDAIVFADPKRKSSPADLPDIHTFEIEHAVGFSLASVYQAFEQGRGANYTWVLFLSSADAMVEWKNLRGERSLKPKDQDSSAIRSKRRVLRAAHERGVGLVAMRLASAPSAWLEVCPAERKRGPEIERDQALLFKSVGLTWPRIMGE